MATRDPHDKAPPMAEPGTRTSGASTGGMASTADGGLQDATQRSFERKLDDAVPGAPHGDAMTSGASPRTDLGGTNEPGSAAGGRPGADVPGRDAGAMSGGRTGSSAAGTGATAGGRTGSPAGTGATAAASPAAPRSGASAAGGSHTAAASRTGHDDDLRGTPPRGSPSGAPTGAGEVEDLPEAPRDESPAESLGRAVSEVVTGVFDSPTNPRDDKRR